MLSERLDRWLGRHRVLTDGLVAGATGLVFMAAGIPVGSLHVAASAAVVAPLAWRRARPVLSAGLVLGAAFAHWVVLGPSAMGSVLPADVVVPVAVYSVTAYGPRWAGRAAVAAGSAGSVMAALSLAGFAGVSEIIVPVYVAAQTSVLAAWALGSLRGVRRDRLAALADRARLLDVERDQQARIAVQAERARIAREMHDVVAHSLAVMIAQADGGRYAAPSSPQAAQESLRVIGDTGRRALAEMRRLLGILRADDDGPGEPELIPQPGLAELPGLVEQVRAGGLPVTLHAEPVPGAVESGLELVVYRIVQEGLTNVIKHAGPAASAQVTVRWAGGRLLIEVADDGRGAAAAPVPDGHGLTGMRERAAAYGGEVTSGPRPGGGHVLRASIPVPA